MAMHIQICSSFEYYLVHRRELSGYGRAHTDLLNTKSTPGTQTSVRFPQNVSPSKTMEWNCSSKCLNRLTKVGNHLRKHITHDIIVVSKTKTIFRKTYYENIETKLSNSKNSFRNFLLSRKILWRCRANSKMRKLPIHQPVSRKAIQSVQWKNALENKIKMVEYGFVKYN